ncbi:amino acid--[acyl-carrier-protein] ligase [Flexivirga sp.]|uniref:amino acid--[acyl-carrier-protein] ligase n=1 Tax=Flexivirga sp. TaxID=1962927 RepID=UPI003F7DBF6C
MVQHTTLATDRLAAQREFRTELIDSGVLVATSVDGLYQRSAVFESVVRGLERRVSAEGADRYEPLLFFPPVLPRDVFVRSDYLRSFPDLTGSVDTFVGDDRDHAELLQALDSGADWTQYLTPAEVMLCSAACHPLYPSLTGTLPVGGRRMEVQGFCFRHEPSIDPARMQVFRQHEFVAVGDPEVCVAHREEWLERALRILGGLGLAVRKVVANDPFFGRAGRMLAANQRDTALKYEIVCPITSAEFPTAIASGNYHIDHFGGPFSIRTADGDTAHSACIGFGMERITLALLKTHGLDPQCWPSTVRTQLAL